jgi:predicted helicase
MALGSVNRISPQTPTIREKFNACRFADHRPVMVDLILRVTRVSVETMVVTEAMKAIPRG